MLRAMKAKMMTGTDWARISMDLMMLSMKVGDYDDSMKIGVCM